MALFGNLDLSRLDIHQALFPPYGACENMLCTLMHGEFQSWFKLVLGWVDGEHDPGAVTRMVDS
jgi:hypothetical protein